MALQMNYYSPQFDITMYNAYWRINPKSGLVGGKDELHYIIEVFKNADMSHVESPQALERHTLMFTPDISGGAENFIKQAYLHAKSTPYFSGSIDV